MAGWRELAWTEYCDPQACLHAMRYSILIIKMDDPRLAEAVPYCWHEQILTACQCCLHPFLIYTLDLCHVSRVHVDLGLLLFQEIFTCTTGIAMHHPSTFSGCFDAALPLWMTSYLKYPRFYTCTLAKGTDQGGLGTAVTGVKEIEFRSSQLGRRSLLL